MSRIRRAGVALLTNISLVGLITLLQAADPPAEKPAAVKEVKEQQPAPAQAAGKVEAAPVLVGGGPQVGVKAAQVQMKVVQGGRPVDVQTPAGSGELTDALTFPTNREIKKRLELAEEDYIKNEAWMQTCQLLQSVLDKPEDVFVQVRRKGANNQEQMRWASARTEANRLLGTMPSKGLDFYELQYGG